MLQVLRFPRRQGLLPEADPGHARPHSAKPRRTASGPANASADLWRCPLPAPRIAVRVPVDGYTGAAGARSVAGGER